MFLFCRRPEDIFLKTFFGRPDNPDRLDCLIEEFLPSRTSTVRLGELVLQELEMVQLIVPQIGDYIFSRFSGNFSFYFVFFSSTYSIHFVSFNKFAYGSISREGPLKCIILTIFYLCGSPLLPPVFTTVYTWVCMLV